MNRLKLLTLSAVALALLPLQPAFADSRTENEVRDSIVAGYANTRKNLRDEADTVHSAGSLQFWSSGGLLQRVPANSALSEYEYVTLTPKHIEVVTIEKGKSAVAMYYAEGSYKEKDGAAVGHYMTRITEVMVKEDGKWKVRAAHYSPIAAGAGTHQSALD